MKILHVLDHSIPLQSGYTFRTLAILHHQRALDWETVHLTSAKHEVGTGAIEEVDGFRFYRTSPLKGITAHIPVVNQLRVISSLERRIHEVINLEQPDIIQAHSPALNGIAALRAGRRHDLPVVYECRAFWEDAAVNHGSCREGDTRYRITRAMETHVFRRADAITTICQGLKSEIQSRGIPEERLTVIPNAVDLAAFPLHGVRDEDLGKKLGLDGKIVLGFIGSFYAYEGLQLLLEALPKVLEAVPEIRLLLVGGGREEAMLHSMAEHLSISDSVIFTGRVSHQQVRKYYELIDVCVYPRLRMRLTEIVTPLKPLEAMARGRPVVASDVGGHRELIRDGENGRLFRAGDAVSLADTLRELVACQESWPEYKRKGREFVERERSWPLSVAHYERVYRQALIRRGHNAGSRATDSRI